ncbi:hypothetical protein [Sporosarcina sp. Marseille-Q4943]|uniref:hypothetical protein n=1 Tax=Sporosarcina sp. Marseille-Q4943 TaxID=2942204 RepID=UPI00208DBE78|nr:hypothetical protein [Sporosarcina sp. Marseille-Q4943]
MKRGLKAYLFMGTTVVTDKRFIANAQDEHFQEVDLIISDGDIMNLHHKIMQELADELDD